MPASTADQVRQLDLIQTGQVPIVLSQVVVAWYTRVYSSSGAVLPRAYGSLASPPLDLNTKAYLPD